MSYSAPPKRSKYGNKKVEVDGVKFDSIKEAHRYGQLKMLEMSGWISNLRMQERFPLVVNGVKVGAYVADFVYDQNGKTVVEDVKSPITRKNRAYRLKRKILAALGVEIVEV